MAYSWTAGGDSGGGYCNALCVDPQTPGSLHAGGDVWGQRHSVTYGDAWYPTNGSGTHTNNPYGRTCYFSSHPQTKGDVYLGCGTLARNANGGFFGRVKAGSRVFEKLSTTWGFGTDITLGGTGAGAAVPRPTGQMIVTDYSAATGLEYIYLASSNGLARATQNGDGNVGSYTSAGVTVNANYGFKALELFNGALYSATWGGSLSGTNLSSIVRRTDNPRGAAVSTTLGNAPSDVHDIKRCGARLLAACGSDGIYEVTNDGAAWTKLSGSFFDGVLTTTIDGDGTTLYASLQSAPSASKNIARSKDGGASWAWVATPNTAEVSFTPWGASSRWWLYQHPGLTEGTNWDCSLIRVDPFNVLNVWASGRRGCWHSRDGGDHWRPAVVGMNGGETNAVKWVSGTTWMATDYDWGNKSGETGSGWGHGKTSTDDWDTVVQDKSAQSWPARGLSKTVSGHTYTISAPNATNATYTMTRDGVRIDDAYFRGAIWDPDDIAIHPTTEVIAVGQFGGGVWVGDPNGGVTAAPDVTVTAVTNLTATSVTLTGTVDPNGLVTAYHWEYGTTAAYGTNTPDATGLTGTTPMPVPRAGDTNSDLASLTPATTYYYRLAATNSLGTRYATGSFTTKTGTTSLAAPVVTLTVASQTQINASWPAVTGATSYRVYRDTTQIASQTATTYNNTGLTPSTAYTYQVVAVGTGGAESPFSAARTATTLALNPGVQQFPPDTGVRFQFTAAVDNRGGVIMGDATITASGGGNVFTELMPGEGVLLDITDPAQLYWVSTVTGDSVSATGVA